MPFINFDKNEYKITDRQNEHTNLSSRFGQIPIAICNHLSGGSFESLDNWFRSPNNYESSADFCVTKEGKIYRYGDSGLDRKTWANGLTAGIKGATSQLVVSKYYSGEQGSKNPNNYTVSIEHESIDGRLTNKQLKATIWLHKWIINEVKELFNYDIPINRTNIFGHNEVDKINKWYCPNLFPFEDVISELKKDKVMKNIVEQNIDFFGIKKKIDVVNESGYTYFTADNFREFCDVLWDEETRTILFRMKQDNEELKGE